MNIRNRKPKPNMNRRAFFASVKAQVIRWAPWLGLLGFHVNRYSRPLLVGWQGSLHWCGQLIGFVGLDGRIRWWP